VIVYHTFTEPAANFHCHGCIHICGQNKQKDGNLLFLAVLYTKYSSLNISQRSSSRFKGQG